MRRYLFPLILGLAGCAILIALGQWQLRRLDWKTALLAEIDSRIAAPAGPLPQDAGAGAKYTPVRITGQTVGQELFVPSGEKGIGAGYEVITAFVTAEGRHILLDRGYIPEDAQTVPRPPVTLTVTGNLHWPEETDSYTPPPDAGRHIWFARDAVAMAAALGTEAAMVVAKTVEGDAQGITPVPISATGIPNDHLNYAITWFSMAAVWAGMTAFLLWRIRRGSV